MTMLVKDYAYSVGTMLVLWPYKSPLEHPTGEKYPNATLRRRLTYIANVRLTFLFYDCKR